MIKINTKAINAYGSQVHEVVHELVDDDETIGYITVFPDGKRVFEFDSDREYTEPEILAILDAGRRCAIPR